MTRKTRSDCRVGTFKKSMDCQLEQFEMTMDETRVVTKRLVQFVKKEGRSDCRGYFLNCTKRMLLLVLKNLDCMKNVMLLGRKFCSWGGAK